VLLVSLLLVLSVLRSSACWLVVDAGSLAAAKPADRSAGSITGSKI